MKDILEEIISHKITEVAHRKELIKIENLEKLCQTPVKFISMKESLEKSPSGIIAEFKRRSPSKSRININADSETIPLSYEKHGAAALSILTDEVFFGGSLKDIENARPTVQLPILRKDFIIDEYQIFEACVSGANAILLIAAAMPALRCKELARKAHELNLEVLLEIHNETELDHIDECMDMIGVNNRNLGTFVTDVENSFRLASKIPDTFLKVSESGISDPITVKSLRNVGYKGFLMGEHFMKDSNPGEKLETFINNIVAL